MRKPRLSRSLRRRPSRWRRPGLTRSRRPGSSPSPRPGWPAYPREPFPVPRLSACPRRWSSLRPLWSAYPSRASFPFPRPVWSGKVWPGWSGYPRPRWPACPQPGLSPFPRPGPSEYRRPGLSPFPRPGLSAYPRPGLSPWSRRLSPCPGRRAPGSCGPVRGPGPDAELGTRLLLYYLVARRCIGQVAVLQQTIAPGVEAPCRKPATIAPCGPGPGTPTRLVYPRNMKTPLRSKTLPVPGLGWRCDSRATTYRLGACGRPS